MSLIDLELLGDLIEAIDRWESHKKACEACSLFMQTNQRTPCLEGSKYVQPILAILEVED